MSPYKFNPFIGNLDQALDYGVGDARYLKIAADNDPLTGMLTITPSSGDVALTANKDIVVKAGQKLVLDGA